MICALLNTEVDVWPAKHINESLSFKWQTRRILKLQPPKENYGVGLDEVVHATKGRQIIATYKPFENGSATWGLTTCDYIEGDLIYAKETWAVNACYDHCKPSQLTVAGMGGQIAFRAGGGYPFEDLNDKWRTAMFMPQKFARIWLRVVNVRVERVNSISEDDAKAEGVTVGEDRSWAHKEAGLEYKPHVTAYSALWETINGKGSWAQNPWVWIYDLARISKP